MTAPLPPGRKRGRLAVAAALALVAVSGVVGRADAQQAAGPNVIMIQVDGLEATDVTAAKTPFLWGSMAHPSGSDPILGPRNGFIWQAPRASVNAGLGANAASYLVGGYPEQTGIPADDFRLSAETDGGNDRVRLGGSAVNPNIGSPAPTDLGYESLFGLVDAQLMDVDTAAFVGDPNLGPMVAGTFDDPATPEDEAALVVDRAWYPTNDDPGNPLLCDISRSPITPPGPVCAANDAVTLARAFQDLNSQAADDVGLTYIELAELGHLRRVSPDADAAPALAAMDTALAGFFNAYASPSSSFTSPKWGNTIVMITGTGGYEPTPIDQRVPDPDLADPGQDLAHDVGEFQAEEPPPPLPPTGASQVDFELIPQGTLATVYAEPLTPPDTAGAPSPAHRAALAQLRERMLLDNAPLCQPNGCIKEVLYMRTQLLPAGGSAADTVEGAHPDWHLDHLKVDLDPLTQIRSTKPTGRSGDLLVVMEPGWAAGKALPADAAEAISTEEVITNPYLSSGGGPRNRSVAAIINGFGGAVFGAVSPLTDQGGVPTGYYPVSAGDPELDECNAKADADLDNLAAANAGPVYMSGDDANAADHLCQAEVLDFAPTVAALLKLQMSADQICGRVLQEAFSGELTLETDRQDDLDAFFVSGPVTPSPGQTYPQTEQNVTFEFNTSVPIVTKVDCGEETPATTTFECSLDKAPYAPCGTAAGVNSPLSRSLGPLALGIHEFCVRTVNVNARVPSEPDCAIFEVVDFFDFLGLLRALSVRVTDYQGNTWAQAPRGRRMDRIAITADYGRKQSAVTLTLYRQSKGKRLCGNPVYRLQATSAARCALTGLARFKPFKLDRGHIALRLKVPRAYKPTHTGLAVQEVEAKPIDPAACASSEDIFCFYTKVGAADGGIVKIVDARRLHKVKGCKGKGKGKAREKSIKKCERRFARRA